jgi:ABC-2 type transport system permease protein
VNRSLARMGAVAVKEFTHVRRDRRVLAIVLVLPVLLTVLLGFAISFDVRHLPTALVDLDSTPASRAYGQAYAASELFDVVARPATLASAEQLLDRDAVRVVVVIPAGFGRALAGAERTEVAVLIDGSETNAAKVAQAYAGALNQQRSQQLTLEWADRQGIDTSTLGAVEASVRTWYNPDRSSSDFLVPGLMVVVIMIVAVQQTAVTLVRERELGTQDQLMISPLRRVELMVGKLAPWALIAFADMAMITALGLVVFGVPLRGSVAALTVGASLFVLAALSLGLIVSAVSPTVDVANIAGLVIAFLPAFMLSGFAFPLDQIPVALQAISYLFPARHMVALSREVFLKGAGFEQVWPELAWLALYAAVALAIAVGLQRRRAR